MARRIYYLLAAIVVVAAIFQAFNIGYGSADEILYHSQASSPPTTPAAERLTVVYERQIAGKADLLHLQVDTTYHARGKGAYKHEIVGKSRYLLRSFDGKYTDMSDAAAACFVMNGREWEATQEHCRHIAGYKCECMQITLNNEPYRVWFTDALPHLHPKARSIDGYSQLILEVRDAKGCYSLQAKYIGQQIG